MRLGIDLGTTRTLVAAADRGNFPLIGFSNSSGDFSDHYPTTSAEVDGELVHGLDAEEAALRGAPVLRSWKRLFSELRVHDGVRIGRVETTLQELATDFLQALRRDLLERSNLPRVPRDAVLEAVVSVPANAHSAQRFATLEAFRDAGFSVRAILNEPSAAGIEYAHRHRETITGRREHVAIYDLGGGTFDAALVLMSHDRHEVVASSGIARLGGDDFDAILLDLALERAELDVTPSADERTALLIEARAVKETIGPNARRVMLELGALGERAPARPVIVDVAAYFDRVAPLVERTLDVLEPVLASEAGESGLAGVCVVGGASALPLIPRRLRERFGRRMHRSPHPAGSVAIGLAIAGTDENAPEVQEVLTRHLGVFRERDSGAEISFDGILPKGSALPRGSERLSVVRRYRAAHNIGHYRFVECGALDSAGGPAGDITPHAQVMFPFSPSLAERELRGEPIERLGNDGPLVEERYAVDAAGVVEVTITNLDDGYERRYVL
jgi:molecular chaperone DnaK (HSP70)